MLCCPMPRLAHYFATLSPGRTILWCYAIWYAVAVVHHFDASLRLWLTRSAPAAPTGPEHPLTRAPGR